MTFRIKSCALTLLCLLTSNVRAASVSELRVHISFPFLAGDKKMPAGDYVVHRMESGGLLLIQGYGRDGYNRDAIAAVLSFAENPGASEGTPGISFVGSEGERRLARVQLVGEPARLVKGASGAAPAGLKRGFPPPAQMRAATLR